MYLAFNLGPTTTVSRCQSGTPARYLLLVNRDLASCYCHRGPLLGVNTCIGLILRYTETCIGTLLLPPGPLSVVNTCIRSKLYWYSFCYSSRGPYWCQYWYWEYTALRLASVLHLHCIGICTANTATGLPLVSIFSAQLRILCQLMYNVHTLLI